MESCVIVPHGTVVFRPAWWARHFATRAATLMHVSRGRFVFLHPLSTRAHVLVTGLPHILPTAEGVLDVSPEEDNALQRRPFVPWSAIGPARANDSALLCAGLGAIACGSPAAARVWARVINTLRAAAPARRAVLADRWLRLRFRPEIARRRAARVDRACAAVEVVSSAAFMVLIAAGVLVTQRVSTPLLLGFLGTGVLSGVVIAICTWIAHARLAPRDWSTRLGRILMMSVCFPVALRARAGLGRDALALVHPVAAATALLPQARARDFIAGTLRRWRHRSAAPRADSVDDRQLARAAETVSTLIADAARSLEIDPATLDAAPRVDDPSVRAWCPRCHATYVHAAGACADCPGVPLRGVPR